MRLQLDSSVRLGEGADASPIVATVTSRYTHTHSSNSSVWGNNVSTYWETAPRIDFRVKTLSGWPVHKSARVPIECSRVATPKGAAFECSNEREYDLGRTDGHAEACRVIVACRPGANGEPSLPCEQ